MSEETFLDHLRDSPFYLPEIAFVGGAIGGVLIVKELNLTDNPRYLILAAVVGGFSAMYLEYQIYELIPSIPIIIGKGTVGVVNTVIDVIGEGNVKAFGDSIQAVKDWFGNPDNKFDVHFMMLGQLASLRGLAIEGGGVRILTTNQKAVWLIIQTFTETQLDTLLKGGSTTFNGYTITQDILQIEGDEGGASINNKFVIIDDLAGAKIYAEANNRDVGEVYDNTIKSGGVLRQGEHIYSPNAYFYMIMQGDGNLVIYRNLIYEGIWASHTSGKSYPPYELIMQNDGNLVIYAYRGNAIWSSGTSEQGVGPYTLSLSDDALLKIVDSTGTELWNSGTRAEPRIIE